MEVELGPIDFWQQFLANVPIVLHTITHQN